MKVSVYVVQSLRTVYRVDVPPGTNWSELSQTDIDNMFSDIDDRGTVTAAYFTGPPTVEMVHFLTPSGQESEVWGHGRGRDHPQTVLNYVDRTVTYWSERRQQWVEDVGSVDIDDLYALPDRDRVIYFLSMKTVSQMVHELGVPPADVWKIVDDYDLVGYSIQPPRPVGDRPDVVLKSGAAEVIRSHLRQYDPDEDRDSEVAP